MSDLITPTLVGASVTVVPETIQYLAETLRLVADMDSRRRRRYWSLL